MKLILTALAAAFTFVGTASACELNRSTEFNPASDHYGQMVVRCGANVVATHAELDARGVDIFDAAAVQAAAGGNLPLRSNGSTVVSVQTKKGSVDVLREDVGHDSRW